jgi:hypothetical protein
MSSRNAVTSAFQNLRPTIIREPERSTVSTEAEERLLSRPKRQPKANAIAHQEASTDSGDSRSEVEATGHARPLLLRKKRERLLLVSFRMPQGLKEKLESVAKKHEINQTDIINEAIEMNLQRYM